MSKKDDKIRQALLAGHSFRRINKDLGVGNGRIRRVRDGRAPAKGGRKGKPVAEEPTSERSQIAYREDSAQAVLNSEVPITEAALIAHFQVDMERWQIVEFVPTMREVSRKHIKRDLEFDEGKITGTLSDDGTLVKIPLYTVRAKFKIKQQFIDADLAKAFRDNLHALPAPVRDVIKPDVSPEADILELALPDVHHGLRSLADETGQVYNLGISTSLVVHCTRDLLKKAGPVSKIVVPMGNDWLNADNAAGTTAHGTPQDEDQHWSTTFQRATAAAVAVIELCREYAETVDVLLIPGNHDTERSHYMATCLGYAFQNAPDVQIDAGLSPMKARLLHDTLVAWHHGDRAKPADLVAVMPDRWAELWGRSKWRELHMGHIHHEVEKDVGAVRVRNFRCLSAQSAWSSKSGYSNVRAATSVRIGLGIGPYQTTYSFANRRAQ